MNKLHPKAVWLFFFRFFIIGIVILAASLLYISQLIKGVSFQKWFLMALIIYLFFSYIWARLAYQNWGYELIEKKIKIEKGVVFKKYVTIPYGRIQNVDIYRGISDRILGLSTLAVQTAGAGTGTTEGKLPGLGTETAEELREKLTVLTEETETGL